MCRRKSLTREFHYQGSWQKQCQVDPPNQNEIPHNLIFFEEKTGGKENWIFLLVLF